MKQDIHPTYNKEATITCACGNEITVGSTAEDMEVEICSECHPFFTGVEKVVDTAGRVEKFKQRQQKAEEKQQETTSKEKKDEENAEAEEGEDTDDASEETDFEDVKEELEDEESDN